MKCSIESDNESQSFQSMANSSENSCGNLKHRKMPPPPRKCFCIASTPICTSWTDYNSARRFVSCEFKGHQNCGFFEWIDPPVCERSKVMISGLFRKNKRIEEEKEYLKRMNKRYLNLMILFGLLILCILIFRGKVD